MLTFKKSIGVAGSREVVLVMRRSNGGGYTPDANEFTGDEPLLCEVWPGEDRASIATLPASWNSASAGKVNIDFPLDVMTTLTQGLYNANLMFADRSCHLGGFALEVVNGVGIKAAPKTYGTYQDLLDELPWIDQFQDLAKDQAQFADARAAAREWITGIILGAVPTCGGRWFRSYERSWDWNFDRQPGTNVQVAEALANDGLLINAPNGRRIVRASTYKALSQILRRAVGRKSEGDLIALSSYYGQLAESTILSSIAEIDTNNDGVADLVYLLGRTATR